MDFRRSLVAVSVTLLTLMLLGGFYAQNLAAWIQWAEYFSFISHSYDAALYFEFTADNYFRFVVDYCYFSTYRIHSIR